MLDRKPACHVVVPTSSLQSMDVKEKLLSSKHDIKAVINLMSVFKSTTYWSSSESPCCRSDPVFASLKVALRLGNYELINLLLRFGANVNYYCRINTTHFPSALQYALKDEVNWAKNIYLNSLIYFSTYSCRLFLVFNLSCVSGGPQDAV